MDALQYGMTDGRGNIPAHRWKDPTASACWQANDSWLPIMATHVAVVRGEWILKNLTHAAHPRRRASNPR